jgi:uncharacterized protein YjbI with pentapeptide repeats
MSNPFRWFVSGVSNKTSWEWLELLLVPVLLAIGAFALENQADLRQQRLADERRESEILIEADRNHQGTLNSYFEQMKDLLLDRNLRESQPSDEVFSMARAITSTTIKELNSERNQLLIIFLRESNLITDKTIDNTFPEDMKDSPNPLYLFRNLNLSDTDLRGTDLSDANLEDANLRDANLRDANLEGTDLRDANLRDANLEGANLRDANLEGADLNRGALSNADLSDANLEGADLNFTTLRGATINGANLNFADLRRADISGADLEGADLRDTDLKGADPRGADLEGADLSGADLRGADFEDTNIQGIKWDNETQWPLAEGIAKARNIPESLKQQLGIE